MTKKLLLVAALSWMLNAQVIAVRHRIFVCTPGSQTFSSVTTWTVPAACISATFEAWGSGGSDGTSNGGILGGSGGGGGAYGKATFVVSGGQAYTISASLGGISSVKLSGTNKVTANNGVPGDSDGCCGGAGGTASIGAGGTSTVTFNGGLAADGNTSGGGGGGAGATSTGNGADASGQTGGAGGAVNGGGDGAHGVGPGSNGQPGQGLGGGAGGGGDTFGSNPFTGKVVITWS